MDGFWVDFGSKLGGKLGPSWHQNLKNGGPKTMSKKVWQKVHATSRDFTQLHAGKGWVGPYKPLVQSLQGAAVGHQALHIVPQGHGGGYIYIYISPASVVPIVHG